MADKYINETGLRIIKAWIEGKFALDSDLDALQAEVDEIVAEGGEPNVIEKVKYDGTELTIDTTDKSVNIPKEVLIARYNTTSYADLYAAINDRKDILLVDSGTLLNPSVVMATTVEGVTTIVLRMHKRNRFVEYAVNANDVWTYNDNLVTMALTSDVPTKLSDLTNDGDGTTGSKFATEEYVVQNGGKINSISVNGTAQTIDANKNVDLSIPQINSSMSGSSEFVEVRNATGSSIRMTALRNPTTGDIEKYLISVLHEGDGGEANVYTTDVIDSLLGTKAEISAIPTAVSDLTNDSGYQTATDVQSAISTAVAAAYKYKGSVATMEDLPSSGNTTGDVWDVQATGVNYAWTGTTWDALGSYVDTSVLWTSVAGQTNTLEAATVAEINAILNA